MWQAFRTELHPEGVEVVTVALDTGGADAARPFIEAASPEHPSLIDAAHVTGELFGFVNVPNAVWIDEDGMLVRPAEPAHVQHSPLRTMDVADDTPEPIKSTLLEVKKIQTDPDRYREMVLDWAERGSNSRYALSPDEVVARSEPRNPDEARAAACFELGSHQWQSGDRDAAVPWWREAHRLQPHNWTYRRQAWSLAVTPPGEETSMLQGPTDEYEGNWLDDVRAIGAENYYPPLQ